MPGGARPRFSAVFRGLVVAPSSLTATFRPSICSDFTSLEPPRPPPRHRESPTDDPARRGVGRGSTRFFGEPRRGGAGAGGRVRARRRGDGRSRRLLHALGTGCLGQDRARPRRRISEKSLWFSASDRIGDGGFATSRAAATAPPRAGPSRGGCAAARRSATPRLARARRAGAPDSRRGPASWFLWTGRSTTATATGISKGGARRRGGRLVRSAESSSKGPPPRTRRGSSAGGPRRRPGVPWGNRRGGGATRIKLSARAGPSADRTPTARTRRTRRRRPGGPRARVPVRASVADR